MYTLSRVTRFIICGSRFPSCSCPAQNNRLGIHWHNTVIFLSMACDMPCFGHVEKCICHPFSLEIGL